MTLTITMHLRFALVHTKLAGNVIFIDQVPTIPAKRSEILSRNSQHEENNTTYSQNSFHILIN